MVKASSVFNVLDYGDYVPLGNEIKVDVHEKHWTIIARRSHVFFCCLLYADSRELISIVQCSNALDSYVEMLNKGSVGLIAILNGL